LRSREGETRGKERISCKKRTQQESYELIKARGEKREGRGIDKKKETSAVSGQSLIIITNYSSIRTLGGEGGGEKGDGALMEKNFDHPLLLASVSPQTCGNGKRGNRGGGKRKNTDRLSNIRGKKKKGGESFRFRPLINLLSLTILILGEEGKKGGGEEKELFQQGVP